jgi:hypothetical protein
MQVGLLKADPLDLLYLQTFLYTHLIKAMNDFG